LFLEEEEKIELPNSRALVELRLDEMPSTLKVDSKVLHSPLTKMNPFHFIFYLNGILVATRLDKGGYCKAPSHTVIL
jgi:hypothetical protein